VTAEDFRRWKKCPMYRNAVKQTCVGRKAARVVFIHSKQLQAVGEKFRDFEVEEGEVRYFTSDFMIKQDSK
jgi:hypothetical protein